MGNRPLDPETGELQAVIHWGVHARGHAHQFLRAGLEAGALRNSLPTVVGVAGLAHSRYLTDGTAVG